MSAAEKPLHVPAGLLMVLAGLSAFAPLSIDMYLPALPVMARDLHGDAAQASLTVAAFFAGLCLGQLVHGPLSDRIGRRGPLLFGLALYVAAGACAALAPSIPVLVAARFIQAFGGCAGLVVSRATVRDRFTPQQSAQVFSLLLLVMSIAPIIAPLIGSWILLLGSWRAIFWLLTGFGALVGLATFWGLPETRSAETAAQARSESPLAAYRAILGERQVMAYALAAGFSHMGLLTYLAISPEVLVSGFHLSPQTYGWVIALNGAGLVTTNWINRRLLARLGYNPILRAANVGSIAASSMLLIDAATGMGGLLGITVPLFFMVGMIGFTQPNAIAGALSSDPQRAGSISALVGFFQFGGGAIGAAVAGAFHDGTPRPMAMVIFGAHVLAFFALRDIDRPKGLIAR